MRRFSPALWALFLAGCSAAPKADDGPPDPPTQQDYTAHPDGTIGLSWHNARVGDVELTVVVRYEAVPDGHPPHGVTPSTGDAFGSGTVKYAGIAEKWVDASLSDVCRAYTYDLWSVDKAGNWAVAPARVEVPRGAGTPAPLQPPSKLTAAGVDGDVQLAWTNPPDSTGWTELRLVRKRAGAPVTPTDGVVVYTGAAASAAEPLAGMDLGTWFYGLFACNGCGLCNKTPATVVFTRAIPSDGGAGGGAGGGAADDGGMGGGGGRGPLTPTNLTLQLSGDGKNVLLSWTNPAEVTQVKVLRTFNAPPLGPGDPDAALVFQGAANNASERVDKLEPNTPTLPRNWNYRVYGCKNASCETTGATTTLSLTVAQALRGGGYTLFWRHATANVCGDQTQLGPANNTTQPNWWKSCDKNCSTAYARQLDAIQSPNETFTIHTQFATRGFAIGRVVSSEFCRATETAQGFAFGPPIETSQVLTYFVYDEAQRCTNTMQLLNAQPAAGTNTALVSHAGFICPVLDSLGWGEAAIYRPNPGNQPIFIARVLWNGWSTLP